MEPDAWERLCSLYGAIVYGWCRRSGLQESDARDATQEVLRTVFQKLDQFQSEKKDSSFRAWLWTITTNQIRLHFRQSQRRADAQGGTDGQQMIAQVPGPDLPDNEPDAEVTRRRILHRALELVQRDFSEQTWMIFERTTLQNESCQQVAEDLEMSSNAVRQARYRVLCRLRQELAELL